MCSHDSYNGANFLLLEPDRAAALSTRHVVNEFQPLSQGRHDTVEDKVLMLASFIAGITGGVDPGVSEKRIRSGFDAMKPTHAVTDWTVKRDHRVIEIHRVTATRQPLPG